MMRVSWGVLIVGKASSATWTAMVLFWVTVEVSPLPGLGTDLRVAVNVPEVALGMALDQDAGIENMAWLAGLRVVVVE